MPLCIITLGLIIFPHFILKEIYIDDNIGKLATVNLINYIFYTIYFVAYLIIAYNNLFSSFFSSKDSIIKIQLRFIFIGTIVPYLLAMYFNLILPFFNYRYVWAGPLLAFFVVWSILYAVYKHHLLNAKVITAEVFTVALWIFILARTLLADSTQDKLINLGLLILTVVVGLLLIRSVQKEVRQREHIEELATDLKKANTRLLELDKQKSEFVSFATHQLRAPLTAMKGYASLILEGDLGVLSKEIKEAISRIFESSKTLTNVVDDYLNISRIELGTMKYSFEIIDLKDMVQNVIAELKPNIEKSGLAFKFSTNPIDSQERFMIHADKDKLKQVIGNLIDNSVKYTPKGSIGISLLKNTTERKIVFSVKDTGVGIAPEVMPKLFAKFIRANNANKQNIYGTGLGLFVAKEIVTAHKGRIWAESAGEGKGSIFFLEMEMAV